MSPLRSENNCIGLIANRFRDVFGLTQSVTPVFAVRGKVGVNDGDGLSCGVAIQQ